MKNRVMGTVCLLLITSGMASAQVSFNWNEFFKQKKTEKRYLAQHIAELQGYITLLKQGYKIVNDGIQTVNRVKNGEFGLHDIFYLSFKLVNPKLRSYPAVGNNLDNHAFIARHSQVLLQKSRDNPQLSLQEKDFVSAVVVRLRTDMAANLDDMAQLLKDNGLAFSDDERLKRLDELAAYTGKRVAFIKDFSSQVLSLAGQRTQEQVDINVIKGHHGLR